MWINLVLWRDQEDDTNGKVLLSKEEEIPLSEKQLFQQNTIEGDRL